MKKILCTARIGAVWLIVLSTFNWGFAQCKLSYANYDKVFEDQFNTYGGAPFFDSNNSNAKWKLGEPCDAQGDDERGYYDPSMVYIVPGPLPETDGYVLRLTAQRFTYPASTCPNSPNPHLWKSGRIETNTANIHLLDNNDHLNHLNWGSAGVPEGFAYGIFEIKCKLPVDPPSPNNSFDIWPAFWLYSGATEIDLIDATQSDPDVLLECGIIDWGNIPGTGSPWWKVCGTAGSPSCNNTNNILEYDSKRPYTTGECATLKGICYVPTQNIPQTGCARGAKKIGGPDLSSAFHVYSVAWTPTAVTFFLNGREINTIPASRVHTDNIPAIIIAELQMYAGDAEPPFSQGGPFHMDIDWIRVWKPKGYVLGTTLPTGFTSYNHDYYSSSTEYINHNIHKEGGFNPSSASTIGVHPEKGSIAFQSANEVYYRGTDNKMYKATYITTDPNNLHWSVQCLHSSNPPANELIGGALTFHTPHNIITYVGRDGRLQFFGYANGWYHWWIDSNFNLPLASWGTGDNVSSVSINAAGDIFYKGNAPGYNLHRLRYNNGTWQNLTITPPNANAKVRGDILTASSGTLNVFYKGWDNRLQEFWYNGSNYQHNWIDNPSNHYSNRISGLPGSMVLKNNSEIAYISEGGRIHEYGWNGSGWVHAVIQHSYVDANYARNGIGWVNNNTIVYGGSDGRIQCFKNNAGIWSHSWVDDYTNTTIYNSFTATLQYNGLHSDISINTFNGNIFYVGRFNNEGQLLLNNNIPIYQLRYFDMESCQEIETVCTYNATNYEVLKRGVQNVQNFENKIERTASDLTAKIYPNPTDNKLSVEIQGADFKYNTNTAIISNIAGQILLQIALTSEISELDISNFPSGVYFIQITNGEKSLTEKIIKR